MRCRAATDGFPYEHFHECTKRYDHRLHDEPDSDVHLCSCGARWRSQRLDTAAHLVAFVAARRWARDHFYQAPDDRMLAIVYDAGYGHGRDDEAAGLPRRHELAEPSPSTESETPDGR